LPTQPVVGRTYRLAVALPNSGPNPTPYLAAQYCGEHAEGVVAGADGSFREAARLPGTFVKELRFSRPGRWALSFMDLDGTFHDFEVRRVAASTARVTPASYRGTEAEAAVGSGDTSAPIWIAVGSTRHGGTRRPKQRPHVFDA
jgi:hypothetical protein